MFSLKKKTNDSRTSISLNLSQENNVNNNKF